MQQQQGSKKRASTWSALFLWTIACLVAGFAWGDSCQIERVDLKTKVRYVIDGDTVVLADGRHLRLIGLNTPELGRRGETAQPYAEVARSKLINFLQESPAVQLQMGVEDSDKYGRVLAHLFLHDGQNVAQLLLAEGLAKRMTIPPNTHFANCYREAETAAKKAKKGLWK